MKKVNDNSTIILTYKALIDSGEIFDETTDDKPITITLGRNELAPSFEDAIVGMRVGETNKVRVDPQECFGARLKDLVQSFPTKGFDPNNLPKYGDVVYINFEKDGEKQKAPASVVRVDSKEVTVDFNHPMAGHHITYDFKVLDIIEK